MFIFSFSYSNPITYEHTLCLLQYGQIMTTQKSCRTFRNIQRSESISWQT